MYEQTPAEQSTEPNGFVATIDREQPNPPEERKNLVTQIIAEVKADAAKWEKSFKRMRDDMKFVRMQLASEQENDDRPKANIVQRHLKTRVASLYAKDPTFVSKRKKRREFKVWDGKRQSLEEAANDIAMSQQAGAPPQPQTVALMMDVQEALTRRQMLDNVGDTLEILLKHTLDEQQPPFKPQCKQLVRRTVVCSVGYIKLVYQRQLHKRPDYEAKLTDITERLAHIERLQEDIAEGELDPNAGEVEELRLALAALQAEGPNVMVREGLVYDFPSPLRIIPDRNTRQLAPGFPGARRVTEEFLLTCDQIEETYGKDIGDAYTAYTEGREGRITLAKTDKSRARVYETYDRKTGLLYVTCEGYPDFLQEPAPPPLPYLETFFPIIPLVFNAIEEEGEIFPESDVRLLRPIQREINRKAEAVREARVAARPLYVARRGALGEEDARSLANHAAHDIIELEAVGEGESIDKVFQPFPKVGVDPNLYETGTDITLMTMVVGAQEANLGSTNGDSATQSSIAENSRVETIASEIDDLNDFLSLIARMSGQILLREMAEETVTEVVGPGTVWPTLTIQQIAEEIYLDIQAGSSGRPNRDRDAAIMERLTPFLLQIPGVDPQWLLKTLIKLLSGDAIDYEEAITAGIPSITAMNKQAQVGTGDPATDPNQQQDQGADNTEKPDQTSGGAQPANPAPSTEQANVAA